MVIYEREVDLSQKNVSGYCDGLQRRPAPAGTANAGRLCRELLLQAGYQREIGREKREGRKFSGAQPAMSSDREIAHLGMERGAVIGQDEDCTPVVAMIDNVENLADRDRQTKFFVQFPL